MKLITGIENFGSVDADNDPLLYEAFENHESYIKLIRGEKFLIVGRKGSGKTAIFKTLLQMNEPDRFSYGYTFSDYPWHYHDLQVKIGVPEFEKFKHSWMYFILMTMSKIILNSDRSIPFDAASTEAVRDIERFVIDAYGSRDVDVTQIFTPTKKLNIKGNLKVNLEVVEGGIDGEFLPVSHLPIHFVEVNRTLLEKVLVSLNPANRYYICFDQLDYGLDMNDPNYTNRIIGLILACRDINLASRRSHKLVNTNIFLRDDIYDSLHFEDKNKVTENYMSKIEWDLSTTQHTLKNLMEKRFQILLREGGEQILWEDVFDETHEMTGRQRKYNYILDRTFNRPRDIIKFSNLLLEKIRLRKRNDPSSPDKFINDDITQAKEEYSRYFISEMDDEIHKHLPDYEVYLNALRNISTWYFTLEDFKNALSELDVKEDHLEVIKKLFRFSIIGFLRAGGKSGGSQ